MVPMRNTFAVLLVLIVCGCFRVFSQAIPLDRGDNPADLQLPNLVMDNNQDGVSLDSYPDKLLDRVKRSNVHRPSLSITNQIDVLRDRLLLIMNRRRTEHQIRENKKILESVGKRRKRHDRSSSSKQKRIQQD